jgi:filamentous hemagglutinin
VAIADDGLKKMAKPQLRQVFCVSEPCSNDQVANTAKIGLIAQKLIDTNPDMTKDQATTLAIVAIVGKDGDPAKADPKQSGSDPNREIKTPFGDNEIRLENIQTVPVTVEDLKNLPNDQKVNSTVFANGIFNNEQRAAELAVQQTPKLDPNDPAQRQQIKNTGTVLQGDTYLVSTDKSNSNSADVNKPFSYQGLDINRLNKAKQPQTNAILEKIQTNPKSVSIAPLTDQVTKVQDQMSKDSNVQMNRLLTTPGMLSVPSVGVPQVPSSRLEQLNQFKQGN